MAGISFVEVLDAGPGWNKVLASDGNVYTLKGDYNWRSNNPGNIEYGKFAISQGAIGSGKPPKGRARGFAIFPTLDAGEQARINLQFESPRYRDKSVKEAIERYAPRSENNTYAYINAVAKAAGVSPDTKMSDLTPEQRQAFLAAQSRVEGFRPGKIMGEDGVPVPVAVAQQFRAKPLPGAYVPAVGTALDTAPAVTPASLPPQLAFTRQMTLPTYDVTPVLDRRSNKNLDNRKDVSVNSGINIPLQNAGIPPLPQMRPPAPGYKMAGKVQLSEDRFASGMADKTPPGATRVASLAPMPPLPRPRPVTSVPTLAADQVLPRGTFRTADLVVQPNPIIPPINNGAGPNIAEKQARALPRPVTKTVMVPNPAYVPPKTAAPGAGLTEAQMRAMRGDMSMVAPKPAAPAVPQFIPQTFTVPTPQYTPPKTPAPLPQPQQNGLLGNLMGMLPKVDFGQIKDNVVNAMAPAALGSVAGRTMIIDPAIRQIFTRQPQQPMAGQTIRTANNGNQVIGQRVNNSDRGYTVSQNDWFNSVRGL